MSRSTGIKAWNKFQKFIGERENSGWMFRGVGNHEHRLLPKVGRCGPLSIVDCPGSADGWDFLSYSEAQEQRIFASFKRHAPLYMSRQCATDWEWLALAQHHGLPTRLLDWTSNPLIAAFFSVSNANHKTDAAIYAVKIERAMLLTDAERKADKPFDVKDVRFVSSPIVSPRMASQKGFFTIHHRPYEVWEAPNLENNTFVIPGTEATFIREKLFSLGVDHAHIMPDLDGLCQALAWQYEEGRVDNFLDY